MSTVDNRIVRMQFDNAQFEAGVMKSMNTIDKLNEKLQFKEAGKGISALQVAIAGVDFSPISHGVEKMAHNFTSITGMLAQRIKTDIVDSAINAAKRLESATLGQIKSGGWARATNIANAKFTIEGLKYSWDEVRKAADYAVTDTAYGLDAAAKAASQLAASGVDFQKIIGKDGAGNDVTQMHKSLRAISGVAAMTNSSFDDISHVFTRIAGQGRVMANDLNSIAARGINAAATLADHFGMTEAEIRDLVSRGQIDFQMFSEAMDDAFGDHAKEANKTFTGSLSNMKAALSRIGAIFAQPVIDKTNTFFISLTSRIKEFQKALSDTTTKVVKGDVLDKIVKDATKAADKLGLIGKEKGDYIARITEEQKKLAIESGKTEEKVTKRFASHFAEAWEAGIEAASKFVEVLNLDWFQSVADVLDNLAVKATDFFGKVSRGIDKFKGAMDTAKDAANAATGGIKEALELDLKDIGLLHRILDNEFGVTEQRWKALDDIYAQGDSGKTGKWLQGYMEQLAKVGYNFEALGWTEEEFKKKQEEATKTEAEKLEVMGNEELVVSAIVQILGNYYDGMQKAKEITSDALLSISSAVNSVMKVITSIGDGLGQAGISFYALAEIAAPVANAMKEFVNALSPTSDELENFIGIGVRVGDFLYDILASISELATEFFYFAAAVVSSREDLDDLAEAEGFDSVQKSVIAVLKVIRDLVRIVKSLGTSIGRVLNAIKNAFKRVFDPSGILTGVSSFTGGLANISEKLMVTEEAALHVEDAFTIIFSVIQKVLEVFSKVAGGIVKFISGGKKVAKTTEAISDSLESAEKVGEKSNKLFESLGKVFGAMFEKIKKLPDKFKEFWTALNQQEGVIRLKASLSSLWETIKQSINGAIVPMTDGLNEFAEATGAAGETGFGTLVDGIGIVAGWIADFIDKLPTWGKQISDFVDRTVERVQEIVENLHIGEFFQTVGEAVGFSFETEGTIVDKIKKFFKTVGDELYTQLSNVDWMKVGKESILALIFANLFNVFKVTDEVATFVSKIGSIPTNLNKILINFSSFITTGKALAKKLTAAYFIMAIARSILMIAAAIYMLSEIPQDKLKDGLAATTWIVVIIMGLSKAIEMATRNLTAAGSYRVTETGISIVNKVGSLFTTLLGLAAVIGAVYLLTKGIGDLVEKLDSVSDKKSIGTAVAIVAGIAAGALVLLTIMLIVSKSVHLGRNEVKSLAAFGVVMAGFGAAVWLIASSIAALNGIQIKMETVMAIVGIISAMTLVMVAAGYAVRGSNWKTMLGFAAVLLVFSGVMWSIAFELVTLTTLLAGLNLAGQLPVFMLAVGVIGLFMITLGASMMLAVHYLSGVDYKSVLSISVVIIAMSGSMILIAAAIAMLAKALTGVSLGAAIGSIAAIILALAGISVAMVFLLKQLAPMREQSWKRIVAVAAVIGALGLVALAIAGAIKLISGAKVGELLTISLTLVAVMLTVLAMMAILKKVEDSGGDISSGLYAVAAVIIAIGGAMLLMAIAIRSLMEFDTGKVIAIAAALTVVIIILGGLAALAAKFGMAEGIVKIAKGIAMIGAGFLLMGAGMYLSAKAMELITKIGSGLAKSINEIAEAIKAHPGVFIGVVATCIAIAVALGLVVLSLTPIVSAVTSVINIVVGTVGRGLTALATMLSTATTNFTTWWNSATPKMKTMFVSLIVTLCAALVKASPEVLKTVKFIIIKVINFIVEMIPVLVDGLVDILLSLLNAFADKIRAESAKIAYALWNVVEALFEVLVDVLVEGLTLILSALKVIPGVGDFMDSAIEGLQGQGKKLKGSLREGLESAQEYTASIDEITESSELAADGSRHLNHAIGSAATTATNKAIGLGNSLGLINTMSNTDLGNNTMFDQVGDQSDSARLKVEALGKAAVEAANNMGENVPQAAKDAYIKYATSGTMLNLGGGYLKKDATNTGLEIGNVLGENITDGVGMGVSGLDLGGGESLFGADNPSAMLDGMNFGADDWGAAGDEAGMTYNEDMRYQLTDEQGYYEAEEENMKSAQQAVKDAKGQHVTAIQENINYPGVLKVRSARPSYEKAVAYCVAGIVDAAKNGEADVAAAMQSLANAGVAAFVGPRGLDENSPSKKTYDAGMYAVLGFVNSIRSQQGLVGSTMEDFSGTVISSFGDPMRYVASMANGDIEYDPSIRPVLDMSGVARGAYGINSMFQNQNVTLSGLSGQLAADIGQLDSRNSDVVAELQALREEMGYLSDDIQQMQVVMDTGALVGTMAGPMDKAMGRRAIYRGRGN